MAGPESSPRLFTLEEANKLLPLIRRILKELRSHRDEVDRLDKETAVEELSWLQPDGSVNPKARQQVAKLQKMRKEQRVSFELSLNDFQKTGAQLKDLDDGLVDFFASRGKEIIYLCWKEGEDRIRHWHDLESGFAGRRPLEDLE